MREVKAAHRRRRPHGITFGQRNVGAFGVEQFKQRGFLGVIRARGITWRWAYALILLRNHRLVIQRFAFRIAPELTPHALVQQLGKGFGQTIRQRLQHDGAVIVICLFKLGEFFLDARTRGNCKRTDVIPDRTLAAVFRRNKITQAQVGIAGGLFVLLTQVVPGHHCRATLFITVDFNVLAIVHTVGGEQAHHAMRLQPFATDDFFQHGLGVGEHFFRLYAHYGIVEYLRIRTRKIPGLEIRAPVNMCGDLGQVVVLQQLHAGERRRNRLDLRPIGFKTIGARLGNRNQHRPLLARVLLTHLVVLGMQIIEIFAAHGFVLRQQAAAHGHAARGIGHPHRGAVAVARCNFHRRVYARGRCPADQQRHGKTLTLHFTRHMRHFFQRRRDQPRQADDVGFFRARHVQHLLARHHHTHINHFIVVALEHHRNYVLADVVHITLDRGDHDLALGLGGLA